MWLADDRCVLRVAIGVVDVVVVCAVGWWVRYGWGVCDVGCCVLCVVWWFCVHVCLCV